MNFIKNYILLPLVLFPTFFYGQFYYGLQQEFGKSRVQFQPFYWTYYDFDNRQIYFYEGCRDIAKYVAYRSEFHLKDLQKKLDYQTNDKLQILVYSNQGDFRQTNLGLSADVTANTGGTTKIVGNKISVYFNGNLADLDRQIRAGITEALIDDILFGGNAGKSFLNSTFLILPDWYKKGLIAYFSEGWNTTIDNIVSDGITFDRYFSLSRVSDKDAAIIGQGLWQHVADAYGESSIANILYMTKVSRNIDNAFMFIVGNDTKGVLYEWIDAAARNAMKRDTSQKFPNQDPIILKPKAFRDYYQLKISPDGKQVVYARNEMTQHRIYLQDLATGKKTRMAKWGPKIDRLNDLTYPLLAWHPSGQVFSVIHEKKGIIYLTMYNIEDKSKVDKPIVGIEKVKAFAYSPDGKKIVMSAVKKAKGQSDIFIYQINAGGLEQITNDVWDDETPHFVNKGNMIAFASNRTHDTLKENDNGRYEFEESKFHDIFLYDCRTKSKLLYRVTDTKNIQESEPTDFYDGYFTYLSDQNGIKNRFAAKLDSVISFVDTTEHYRYVFNAHPISNYKTSVLEQDLSIKANKVAEIFYVNGKEYMYINPINKSDVNKNYSLRNTYYRRAQIYAAKAKTPPTTNTSSSNQTETVNPTQPNNSGSVDINNYSFKDNNASNNQQPNTSNPQTTPNTNVIATNNQKNQDFKFPIQKNYYVNFAIDQVIAQVDNSFLNQTYEKFTGYYVNPGLNAFLKIATSDLFEDYRITAGMRMGYNLNNEYIVSVENRKKLWDKQLVFHRLSLPAVNDNGYMLKILTHDVQYRLKYPINEVSSVKGTFSYRNDKTIYSAQDDPSLKQANVFDNWVGFKTEYVFDNTRPKGLNLYNGWRLKIFAEYYEGINIHKLEQKQNMVNAGFDIRHYLKVHRDLIWANRLAGASSWGTDRICYYLGGVDNQIAPKFNSNEQIKHPDTYGFQTIATNMRGFTQNARNGNNFAVFNSELRFPIFKYFANHPIRSAVLNNFQLIPFVDVGMCWYGTNPFSIENTTNKYSFYQNPITVVINEPKQAIIAGYGFGLRTQILGYFVRVDFSWGIDNQVHKNEVTYFSLTTDF
ncbi:MAG: TolB family protein [Bacteroidia bacterium]